MRIVILDGYSVNPGDLTWNTFAELGELTAYDDTEQSAIVERASHVEAIFVNRCTLDSELLGKLPNLKFIGTLGTGYNMIDLDYCLKNGVAVYNVPGYSTDSVAQHTFALILQITNSVSLFDRAVRQGHWSGQKELSFLNYQFTALSGKKLGIIGLGSIGRKVSLIAQQFGMQVIATSRTNSSGADGFIEYCSLEELLHNSDIISIHCPLNDQSRKLINKDTIKLIRPDAILVNTARGGIIDEQALADALNEGRLRAAALDVLTNEPPERDCPLLGAKNCLVTPHIAWATKQARARLIEACAQNLASFMNRSSVNRVI